MFKYLTILNTRQAVQAMPTLAPLINEGYNRYIVIQEITLSLHRKMFGDMVELLTPSGGRNRITTVEALGENNTEIKFLVGFVESRYDGRRMI